ncbi:tRNA (adenosine(37)-N6)-dimethylallyltransferase MiaA [Treponema sp.]|uniref:tRNA (adenosine(37)-N6)-dimethylallyltransferase MiaA n=1 Tax=Treponema sp. TaxID=166 RepID=UPI002A802340|nr:tRNA (adenosine(37)-N6)-dimethylallyltransferase MiaA [Treponema sp.]MCI6441412.1 tRNA (adenosine(37)-N6)-dimethylallyltransferase MiaA [Spirochaetia bacterium]MDY4131788.1 tRNA (adenosine(37)-N6)-dimethylallyltransferase MiaA [Treponema sp.]
MADSAKIPVIVFFAPTATGKTALTLELFGSGSLFDFKNKAEILSCDSQAVYKYFDIGTAKPTPEERAAVPYHLVDFADPAIQFGLGEFMEEADRLCGEIWSRKNVPVLCGGTGFYARNFILGAPTTPESDEKIRVHIKEKLAELGKESLYAELKIVDPLSARKININDEYRICRALEVFYTSGKPLSSYALPDVPRSQYEFLTIILYRDKDDLYRRIDLRVEKMFEEGLAEEIEKLKSMGYTKDTPAMKAIGYSEFFIDGLSVDQVKEKIKNDSHHYAKKQYTFMRGIPGAVTVDADDKDRVAMLVGDFISSV